MAAEIPIIIKISSEGAGEGRQAVAMLEASAAESGRAATAAARLAAAQQQQAATASKLITVQGQYQAKLQDLQSKFGGLDEKSAAYDRTMKQIIATENQRAATIARLEGQLARQTIATTTAAQAIATLQQREQQLAQSGAAQETARLEQQQQKLAQSSIRLATAQRNYGLATALVDAELQKTAPDTARYNALLQQKIAISNKATAASKSLAAGTRSTGEGAASAASLIKGMLPALSAAAIGFKALQIAGESFNLVANIDANRRALTTLIGDQGKANQVYQEASVFAEKYGYTQKEIASATAAAAPIFKSTSAEAGKVLEVLGRLAAVSPEQGIEGATFAVKELIALDTTSLAERFNISRQAANKMKEAIAGGADPIKVLDKALNDLGASSQILSNRLEGPGGAMIRMTQATEKAEMALGNLLVKAGAPEAITFLAERLNEVSTALGQISGATPTDLAAGAALEAGQSYGKYAAEITKASNAHTLAAQKSMESSNILGYLSNSLLATQTSTEMLTRAEFLHAEALRQMGYNAQLAADIAGSGLAPAHLALATAVQASNDQMTAGNFVGIALNTNYDLLKESTTRLYGEITTLTDKQFEAMQAQAAADVQAARNTQTLQILTGVTENLRQGHISNAQAQAIIQKALGVTEQRARVLLGVYLQVAEAQAALGLAKSGVQALGDAMKNAAAKMKAYEQNQRAIAEAQYDLMSAEQKLADVRRRLNSGDLSKLERLQALKEERDLVSALAAEQQRGAKSAASAQKKADAAAAKEAKAEARDAADLEKARDALRTDEEKLAVRLARLRAGGLGETERLELEKQVLDLNEKIADSKERQYRAELDARKLRLDDAKQDEADLKRAEQAQRVLRDANASAAQKTAARRALEEIDIENRRREADIAAKERDAGAGGSAPTPGASGAAARGGALVGPPSTSTAPAIIPGATAGAGLPSASSAGAGVGDIVLRLELTAPVMTPDGETLATLVYDPIERRIAAGLNIGFQASFAGGVLDQKGGR